MQELSVTATKWHGVEMYLSAAIGDRSRSASTRCAMRNRRRSGENSKGIAFVIRQSCGKCDEWTRENLKGVAFYGNSRESVKVNVPGRDKAKRP